jgi:hypothetical protein
MWPMVVTQWWKTKGLYPEKERENREHLIENCPATVLKGRILDSLHHGRGFKPLSAQLASKKLKKIAKSLGQKNGFVQNAKQFHS